MSHTQCYSKVPWTAIPIPHSARLKDFKQQSQGATVLQQLPLDNNPRCYIATVKAFKQQFQGPPMPHHKPFRQQSQGPPVPHQKTLGNNPKARQCYSKVHDNNPNVPQFHSKGLYTAISMYHGPQHVQCYGINSLYDNHSKRCHLLHHV